MWDIEHTEEFESWWNKLTEQSQKSIAHDIEVLRLVGPGLSRPSVDTLKDSKFSNMKELRTKSKSHVFRVLFAFDPRQSAILLIGGDKTGVKSNKFYKRIIAQADRIYGDHLEQLNQKGTK